MKVGSIVECINNAGISDTIKLNTPYTIREILPVGSMIKSDGPVSIKAHEVTIRLEELSIIHTIYVLIGNVTFRDMSISITRFRELLPNVANVVEEILSQEHQGV